jgi:methyl-accepting chemotaxis protein
VTRRSRSAPLERSTVAESPGPGSPAPAAGSRRSGGSLRARLTAAFSGVALLSTALTLGFHDRELRRDLETAAGARLETSAAAVRLLSERHLGALAARYAAASSSRWLRDLMDPPDRQGLDEFAARVRARNGAARIIFVDSAHALIGSAGELFPEDRLAPLRGQKLVEYDGAAYAAVSVPIRSGDRTLGRVIAVEPLGSQTVAAWSKLCGARVLFASSDQSIGADVERTVMDLGGLQMRVGSSLVAEADALARSRRNLLVAGAVGLGSACLIGFALSGGLVRPIRELKSAAEVVGSGDFRVKLESDRGDEIGDVSRSFAEMAGSLRATLMGVTEAADQVEETATAIEEVVHNVSDTTANQTNEIRELSATMDRIGVQVMQAARTASDSANALNASVDGSSDSFRQLGSSGEELRCSAEVLSQQSDQLSTAIENITASARQIVSSTESVATAAEETLGTMEEMAGASREASRNAEHSGELSKLVIESAERGLGKVRRTVQGLGEIRGATESAREVIYRLDGCVAEIGSILGLIEQITAETSLLSLNASIIAAQAGEKGQAFAIVAREMDALANRTAVGTRKISEVIGSAQHQSHAATDGIDRGLESVHKGVGLAEEAGKALEEITGAARESADRVSEIVQAMTGQAHAAGHVVSQMEGVRTGVDQIRIASRTQRESSDDVLENSRAMGDAARQVCAATAQQAGGVARIGRDVEVVRAQVEQITQALRDQSTAFQEAVACLDRTDGNTASNRESVARMQGVVEELLEQAEAMRKAVTRFRV